MLKIKRIALFIIISVLAVTSFVSLTQAAGVVDSTFNAQIQTTNYRSKVVYHLVTLPDGKILAAGTFNNYNGSPVGGFIRLNADATLDTTFNNNLVAIESQLFSITLHPDGKILLQGSNITLTNGDVYSNSVIRLNADGSFDSSFNYPYTGNIYNVRIDANGRIMIAGFIRVVENGQTVNKDIIRLNDDGSIDTTFAAPNISHCLEDFTNQDNKYLYTCWDSTAQQSRIFRLNEDGTSDSSFTSTLVGNSQVLEMRSQPDRKILILSDNRISRLSENGGIDPDFQITTNFSPGQPRKILLQDNGSITIAYAINSPFGMRVIRLLADGTLDPGFTPYNYVNSDIQGHTVQLDGSVLIGDQGPGPANRFIRLLPSGAIDTSFNPGGSGFQNINPGKIRAIKILADEKVLIGGDFDKINNAFRAKIARLNSDSTLDESFQINTSGTGNYFSQISDVYYFDIQNDGKILVSGNFTYLVGGFQRSNLVRLNPNGSIDSTFNLSVTINDHFLTSNAGRNKPLRTPAGKILVGTSRLNSMETTGFPLLLNDNGSKDNSFNPTLYPTANSLTIFDTAIQADGKFLVAGRHTTGNINQNILKGFIVRLNSNGTVDETFQTVEILDKEIFAFAVLQNGQILIVSRTSVQSEVSRLNTDGSFDNTFNTGIGANGKINALAVLPDNKILVGGAFSTYNDAPRQNLAMLDSNGNLDESLGNINREVLCITVDREGRVLIGGHFTVISNTVQSRNSISVETQQVTRSYLARLIVSSQSIRKPYFDFDGDGKTDISIFRPSVGEWWYLKSSDIVPYSVQFGQSTDKIVPADYTGDGKTDIAFWRESTSEWFIIRSEDSSFYAFPFGQSGDIPTPGDFDGDGKTDVAVFRPSGATWYILRSSDNGVTIQQFGVAEDKPIVADYDGDGKDDIAIFRPSVSEWWILRSSLGLRALQFGQTGDKTVIGDYTGDGKSDVAFYRPSTGYWYILRSEDNSYYAYPFGTTDDIPTPGDYDGDGKMDAVVFRPSNSTWYLQRSSSGFTAIQFGSLADIPVPSAYIP